MIQRKSGKLESSVMKIIVLSLTLNVVLNGESVSGQFSNSFQNFNLPNRFFPTFTSSASATQFLQQPGKFTSVIIKGLI